MTVDFSTRCAIAPRPDHKHSNYLRAVITVRFIGSRDPFNAFANHRPLFVYLTRRVNANSYKRESAGARVACGEREKEIEGGETRKDAEKRRRRRGTFVRSFVRTILPSAFSSLVFGIGELV